MTLGGGGVVLNLKLQSFIEVWIGEKLFYLTSPELEDCFHAECISKEPENRKIAIWLATVNTTGTLAETFYMPGSSCDYKGINLKIYICLKIYKENQRLQEKF